MTSSVKEAMEHLDLRDGCSLLRAKSTRRHFMTLPGKPVVPHILRTTLFLQHTDKWKRERVPRA